MEPYLNRRQLLVYLALVLVTLAVASQFLAEKSSKESTEVSVTKSDSTAIKLTAARDSIAKLTRVITTLETRIKELHVDSSSHEIFVDGKLASRDTRLIRNEKDATTKKTVDTITIEVAVHDTTRLEVVKFVKGDSTYKHTVEVVAPTLYGFVGIGGESSVASIVPQPYAKASLIKTLGMFYAGGSLKVPILDYSNPGIAAEVGLHF